MEADDELAGGLRPDDSPIDLSAGGASGKRQPRGKLKMPALPAALRLDDKRVLNQREVKDIRPRLVAALVNAWAVTDGTITRTNRKRAESFIWRDIDQEDTETIADALLSLGTRHAGVAVWLRGGAAVNENYRVAMIIGPRVMATVKHYLEHGVGLPKEPT